MHGGTPLLRARSIAIVASLVTISSALAAIPLAAFGDDDSRQDGTTPSAQVEELLEVREHVDAVNAAAIEDAPAAATASRCRATADIDGIGNACVDPSGLLRVEQADGRSHTIHGMDAPPVGASAYAPTTAAAVQAASVQDIVCVSNDKPHYTLVYAHPGNVASRLATIAPALRQEVYKVSAFIDSESQSVSPTEGRRLPVRCDGAAEPTVLHAPLAGLSNGTASFASIVDALRDQGYEFNGDKTGLERYVVYYDSPSPTHAAGTGHVFTTDDTGNATNQNNKGGLYSVEYRFDQGGGVPHWEVLIHEIMHTMGAVVDSAPNATGAGGGSGGHCNDGEDMLCYDDGGPRSSYRAGVCPTKVLDCNRDDYFNPAPAAGTHLASKWNAAATYNRYLVAHVGGTLVGSDGTANEGLRGGGAGVLDVNRLRQSGASRSAVGISWSSSGAKSYVVRVRKGKGRWRTVVTTSRNSASIDRLKRRTTYEVSVAARGSDGQLGIPATTKVRTNAATDRRKPSRPGAVRTRQRQGTVTFSWGTARDNVGVQSFDILHVSHGRSGRTVTRRQGRTPDTSMTFSTRRLKRSSVYVFQVVARDSAGNVSKPRTVRVRILAAKKKVKRPSKRQ